MATTVPAFEKIHNGWLAIIHEAIDNFSHFSAVPHLQPIMTGDAVVVWNNLDRNKGLDNRAVYYLFPALIKLANQYRRDGLEISAYDCQWLAYKFKNEEMTVIDKIYL